MVQSLALYRRFVIYLIILSIIDWYFTCYGIQKHYVQEANPLLSVLMTSNPFLVLAWKCAFPLVLFFLLPYCRSIWIQHGLLFTVCMYIIVNIYHLMFFCLHTL
jgi:hypothetical protein